MTMHPEPSPRDDARALQARLYREIGVAAVAAALLPAATPGPASTGIDKPAGKPQMARPRAA